MKKSLASLVHPYINSTDSHWSEEIVRRDFPNTVPTPETMTVTSEHARIELQAFADIFELPAEDVLNLAIMYWFDSVGADAVLDEENIQKWLAADSRRTRAGFHRKQHRELFGRKKKVAA